MPSKIGVIGILELAKNELEERFVIVKLLCCENGSELIKITELDENEAEHLLDCLFLLKHLE